MTASPPWAITATAMSGVSVATATRPIPAASARRSTWTTIGRPAMSNSGFSGSREAAMRAGIITRVRDTVIGFGPGQNDQELVGIGGKFGRLYGLPERGQTDISSWLRVRCESLIPDAHPRPLSRPSVDLFRPGA